MTRRTLSSPAKRRYTKRINAVTADTVSPDADAAAADVRQGDASVSVDAQRAQISGRQDARPAQEPPGPVTTLGRGFDIEDPLSIPTTIAADPLPIRTKIGNGPAEIPDEAGAATQIENAGATTHSSGATPEKNIAGNATEENTQSVPTQKPVTKIPPNPEKMSDVFRVLVETYRLRPVEFVEDLLIRDMPGWRVEPWQKEFLRAIARGERRISVRAGHGVGKSAACAWALVWWQFTRFPMKAILTAPTQGQLFDALFAEVTRWINAAPPFMRELIEPFSDRVELKASPENSFMSARTSSPERPEALAGVHSDNVLLVCDEAPGIPEAVYEAAVGSMSGYSATTILIGNPTRNSGLFFKTHHQLASEWFRMHVSCVDSTLVSKDFIRQIATTYGEASNAYRVRVLGEFPLREDDVLIPAELVDAAMQRDVVLDTHEPILYGLDVARFGDDRTVLCKRQGNCVLEIKSWSMADLMETCGRVFAESKLDKPSEVMVDSIGMGGGVADRLRELGLNVRDVNVSETSALNIQAAKLRDELWLTLKEFFGQRMCRIPRDDELRQELIGPTYTFLSNGRIKVEGKSEMKKRGLRSPDKADALCLTFAGQAAFVGGRASSWVRGKPLQRLIRGVV